MAKNHLTDATQILVVDDEPDLRTLYELTLLREGYAVKAAADVNQAKALLDDQRFDLVITDMRLPDGSGLDLLSQCGGGRGPAPLGPAPRLGQTHTDA
jgi:two-component system response regulator PilR (NtrC family)